MGSLLEETFLSPSPDAVKGIKVEVFPPEHPFGGVQVEGVADIPIQLEINTGSPVFSVFGRTGNIVPKFEDYDEFYAPIGAAAPVTSVFGRLGAVAAVAGDYAAFYPRLSVAYDDPAWINSLSWSKITGAPPDAVTSVFGRTGAVTAQPGDYTAAQVTNAVSTLGSYANPTWLTSLAWTKITGTPTTLGGYGITDAQPLDADLTAIAGLATTPYGRGLLPQVDAAGVRAYIGAGTSSFDGTFASLSGKPTTLAGYGITDPVVLTSGSYANPTWITSLAWSKITGAPSFEPSLGNPSTNGYILSSTTAGVRSWIAPPAGGGGGTPGGSDTYVQFNDAGAFGADSRFNFNKASGLLTVGGLTINQSALTNSYIQSASGGWGLDDVTFGAGLNLAANRSLQWGSVTNQWYSTKDVGLSRNAAGVLEINNGTLGTYRDLNLRNLVLSGSITPAVEPALGNPSSNGFILSSTSAGVRSWVTPSSVSPVGGAMTLIGDAAYTILSTDKIVATNAALTNVRNWTLPAANSVAAGYSISVIDLAGVTNLTNYITILRAGSDTLQPGSQTNYLLRGTNAGGTIGAGHGIRFTSNGSNKWYMEVLAPGTGSVVGQFLGWHNTDKQWRVTDYGLPFFGGIGVAGKIWISDGTNMAFSTPTYPNSATANKIIIGNGSNLVLSTPAWPNTTPAANKILISNGTDWQVSTPAWPNTNPGAGKILIGNGTDWGVSTPTYPTAAGASGNVLTSDGTNWTSAASPDAAGWDGVVKVSGSDFTTTLTSVTNITGLTTSTLALNTLYEFECTLFINSSTTAGMAVAFSGTGGALTSIVYTGIGTLSAALSTTFGGLATDSPSASLATNGGDGFVYVRGYVLTAGSGTPTIIAKCAKTTGGTAKVYIGSALKWRKV